jgi:hypothetical protein
MIVDCSLVGMNKRVGKEARVRVPGCMTYGQGCLRFLVLGMSGTTRPQHDQARPCRNQVTNENEKRGSHCGAGLLQSTPSRVESD